ncbi:hypothetical protein ACSU1N_00720 [Thermogladius sp. 4427co]|uniref:hypothetical protein n=1 Tax=Thermogladius sp. 4427co TaxID=3450718 RepID=UPI003F78DACF
MKGASDVLSTILMVGVFLTLLSITLAYAYYTSFANTFRTEYLYYRQVMLNMASNLYYVLNGGGYTVTYPKTTMSMGYRLAGYIRFYVNSSTTPVAEIPCYTITSASFSIPSQGARYIYGGLSPVVNDTRLLSSVREFYENNSARIELDTCRVYASVQATYDRLGSFYYFNILAVSLNPVHKPGGGYAELYPSSINQYWFYNVYNLTIVVKSPGSPSIFVLGPRDISNYYTGGPVTLSLTVVNVSVVLT